MAQTIIEFINEKITNCILYIEKTIGKENDLYAMITNFKKDEKELLKFAELLSSVAKKNDKGFFYFEEATVEDYLKNTMHLEKFYASGDEKIIEFTGRIKRYLELFLNTLCK